MHIKEGYIQFKKDIKEWYKGIIAVIIYIVIANLIWGNICTMVVITGLPCPACGLTRAGVSLITLHFADAWNYNCVIFLIVPLILYWFSCRYLFQCRCRGAVPWLVVITICLIGLYIYRMMNYFPHTPPMVYNEDCLLWFLRNLFL